MAKDEMAKSDAIAKDAIVKKVVYDGNHKCLIDRDYCYI